MRDEDEHALYIFRAGRDTPFLPRGDVVVELVVLGTGPALLAESAISHNREDIAATTRAMSRGIGAFSGGIPAEDDAKEYFEHEQAPDLRGDP